MPLDILIVDENAAVLAAMVAALTEAGHTAIGAPSFRDGIRALTSSAPALLISSVRLGPFNGLHLLMRGRAEHPGLPAILIGPPSDVVAGEARAMGAAVYLPQPVDMDVLTTLVTDLSDPPVAGPISDVGVSVSNLPVLLEG